MEDNDFKLMSNSEIRLKIKAYEDEYSVIKTKIAEYLERMQELDSLYDNGMSELKKRNAL